MAGWKEIIFKGTSVSDLGMVGAAQGDILMAGADPFTFAVLTTGTVGQVLASGGAGAALSWEDAALADGVAQGDILVAGADPFTFAVLTKGTDGHVLTAGASTVSWTAAGTGDFLADGTVAMTGNLDFNDNCAVDLKLYTTVPGVPADGHIYFDSVADKVKVYVA